MSEKLCGQLSMAPLGGGATFIGRAGQISANGAHSCELPAGHEGCHARQTLEPLGPEIAMQTTYLWSDENALHAQVGFVPIETSIKIISPL